MDIVIKFIFLIICFALDYLLQLLLKLIYFLIHFNYLIFEYNILFKY